MILQFAVTMKFELRIASLESFITVKFKLNILFTAIF